MSNDIETLVELYSKLGRLFILVYVHTVYTFRTMPVEDHFRLMVLTLEGHNYTDSTHLEKKIQGQKDWLSDQYAVRVQGKGEVYWGEDKVGKRRRGVSTVE